MKYKIEKNKLGAYFIKQHKYYYLDSFEIYGLNKNIWYDKIDYILYKVKFIYIDNTEYIQLKKVGNI